MTTLAADRKKLKIKTSPSPIQFQEQTVQGQVDAGARTAKVILITEGLGNLRDKNFYAKSAIASAVQVFNGKQFYIDHPSSEEEQIRPERSVAALAGWFSETSLGSVKDIDTGEPLAACFATLNFADSPPGELALGQVRSALRYQQQFPGSKDVYCGISINAGGISEPGEIEGMEVNVVHQIDDAFSADIVTKPARGGKFLALSESDKSILTTVEQQLVRYASSRVREALAKGEIMTVTTKKRVLNEAEGNRLHELKRKKTMTEAEQTELKDLRKKIREAREAEAEKAKNLAAETETEETEDEEETEKETEEGEKETEKEKETDEAEAEDDTDESEDEGEDEEESEEASEAEGDGYKKPPKMSVSEGLGGLVKKIEAYLGEGETTTEVEAEDGETDAEAEAGYPGDQKQAPPDKHPAPVDQGGNPGPDVPAGPGDTGGSLPDPSDPQDILKDILMDIKNLMALLGGDTGPGGPGDAGMQDEDEVPGGPPAVDRMANQGPVDQTKMMTGPAMRYACASCGENNEVLAPKGYSMVKTSEAKHTNSKSALREAVERLEKRLAKKEGRFVENNARVKAVMQENISLKAKLAARTRADKASLALREAKVPADILSPAELIAFDPSQWGTQIKFAQRSMARETQIEGGAPARVGSGRVGDAPVGAKVAKEAFNTSYDADRD